MPVNPKCKLELSHSARPMQIVESTWSDLGWRYFRGDSKILEELLKDLRDTGRASYTDKSGTLYINALGDIDGG